MNAARFPRRRGRMLVVDPLARAYDLRAPDDLVRLLPPGALVVVNESGTWPASLALVTETNTALEARFYDVDGGRAVTFGPGDWRTPTEQRGPGPALHRGQTVKSRGGHRMRVLAAQTGRVTVVGVDAPLREVLLAEGRPVQYSYLDDDLRLVDVQSPIAGAPASSEMPSASRVLNVERLIGLRRAGFVVVPLTHGAGLSAVGAAEEDMTLPWPERYRIPADSWAAVRRAKREGRAVVAVGTTVARALEGGQGVSGTTDHVLGAGVRRAVVDAIVTGVHDLDSSHHRLLGAFLDADLLRDANGHATAAGLLGHEFGDFTLVAPGALAGHRQAAA